MLPSRTPLDDLFFAALGEDISEREKARRGYAARNTLRGIRNGLFPARGVIGRLARALDTPESVVRLAVEATIAQSTAAKS